MKKLKLIAKITDNRKVVGYRLQEPRGTYVDVNDINAATIAYLGYIEGVKSTQRTGSLFQVDEQLDLRRLPQIPQIEIRKNGNACKGEFPDCVKQAIKKYSFSEALVDIIKQGYIQYGVLESSKVGLRQFWSRCESHKEDCQYNDVPNTELSAMLSRTMYNRDGQIFIKKNNLLMINNQTYHSLADMLIYIDLVFNGGRNLR